MITDFMNLDLPVVSTTLGPEWASKLNDALILIDSHNHTDGKGVPVIAAGLDIDADVSFSSFRAIDLKSTRFDEQLALLTGADHAQSVFSYAGDLYYTNASGSAVQITDGGSVVTTPSTVQAWQYDVFSTDVVIGAGDAFVFMDIDASAPRDITLPLAANVATGRFYIVSDGTGESEDNPITILCAGSDTFQDGETELVLESNDGSYMLVSNGTDKWSIS